MASGRRRGDDLEQRPLLSSNHQRNPDENSNDDEQNAQKVEFDERDDENPREWPVSWKYTQSLQIFILAFVCPMASSIFAPAVDKVAAEFETTKQITLIAQAGFVCMLGLGPLFQAPMSETFGRRRIFLINLLLFTLLQIPTALAPNITAFIIVRTLSGFFGSVGVANGGGSISDMFETHERAKVLGFYLTAPLLGPTIGPLIGGLIVGSLHWRWIFWIVMVLAALTTAMCYLFLYESQAKTILQYRKQALQQKHPDTKYIVEGVSDQSLLSKIGSNSTRAIRILTTQPIVMTMSIYQALVFSSMYSLYAQYSSIFSSPPYNFSSTQIGLAYLGPAIGFVITAIFIVLLIDRVYNTLAARNNKKEGEPEYRLPLSNIGAVFLPISLFWFGWSVEKGLSWPTVLAATLLFGASQVSIFNCIQTYYIDSYEDNAASALAAGAFLRSMVGGIVPLFVGGMFDNLGYGWGMSVFGILSLILMPAPGLFYWYGKRLREKFPFKG